MNQWQFYNYLVFFLRPSHVTFQQEQEGGSLVAGGLGEADRWWHRRDVGNDVEEKGGKNLIYYLRNSQTRGSLTVVLVCFGQGAGTHI